MASTSPSETFKAFATSPGDSSSGRAFAAGAAAAGFAPVWRQTNLAAPEFAQIRTALDFMLAQQEPFPAVAVDRHWNLLQSNSGAVRLVDFVMLTLIGIAFAYQRLLARPDEASS